MKTHDKETFYQQYEWAKTYRQLPWAHEEPTLYLADICRSRPGGRALDMGCGAGTDSVFLARQGWQVTALDFMPKALEYTKARADAAGVSVELVEADITSWDAPAPYDLVLDHGLMHNLNRERYAPYRERVLKALAPDGDFVLLHWLRRTADEPQSKVGPTRTSREDLRDFFAPELRERFFALEEFGGLPEMVGGSMAQGYYWFRRSPAELEPAELLAQVRRTLETHDVDVSAAMRAIGEAAGGPALPREVLAVGEAGRLGIFHRALAPDQALARFEAWAARTGEEPQAVRALLQAFGSTEHGNVCTHNPRCTECEVRLCNHWRSANGQR